MTKITNCTVQSLVSLDGDPRIPYVPRHEFALRLRQGPNFIPPALHEQVLRWIERGQRPGAFLSAVLSNDLLRAIYAASELEESRLPKIVRFIHMEFPTGSYGGPEVLVNWPQYLRARERQLGRSDA